MSTVHCKFQRFYWALHFRTLEWLRLLFHICIRVGLDDSLFVFVVGGIPGVEWSFRLLIVLIVFTNCD